MDLILNEVEIRIIGALIEKQISTPDYYPMTLNALTNACNQKSSRDPVVSYDEQTVVRGLDSLREKKLAYVFHGSESRVPKYGHIFDKSFGLAPAETAAMCVLMLRGPQTPGEIRSRTGSLYSFSDLAEVEAALNQLETKEPDPLIIRLPRQPGTKESRYAHLLAGKPDFAEFEAVAREREPARIRVQADNERIAKLEEEVRLLREEVSELKQQLGDFRKQFE
ncbi:MAG TPA: YceH family protein [Blastocatellia bacterium]|nr:YceH family protein [Blastocatellia bacterium]